MSSGMLKLMLRSHSSSIDESIDESIDDISFENNYIFTLFLGNIEWSLVVDRLEFQTTVDCWENQLQSLSREPTTVHSQESRRNCKARVANDSTLLKEKTAIPRKKFRTDGGCRESPLDPLAVRIIKMYLH